MSLAACIKRISLLTIVTLSLLFTLFTCALEYLSDCKVDPCVRADIQLENVARGIGYAAIDGFDMSHMSLENIEGCILEKHIVRIHFTDMEKSFRDPTSGGGRELFLHRSFPETGTIILGARNDAKNATARFNKFCEADFMNPDAVFKEFAHENIKFIPMPGSIEDSRNYAYEAGRWPVKGLILVVIRGDLLHKQDTP